MNRHSEQVIAKAEATRAELVKECHSLIVKLAYRGKSSQDTFCRHVKLERLAMKELQK